MYSPMRCGEPQGNDSTQALSTKLSSSGVRRQTTKSRRKQSLCCLSSYTDPKKSNCFVQSACVLLFSCVSSHWWVHFSRSVLFCQLSSHQQLFARESFHCELGIENFTGRPEEGEGRGVGDDFLLQRQYWKWIVLAGYQSTELVKILSVTQVIILCPWRGFTDLIFYTATVDSVLTLGMTHWDGNAPKRNKQTRLTSRKA